MAIINLDILYHDEYLVIINKPAKLLIHKSAIDKYETENAMTLLRNQLGQWVYPIHRLDKATSGVLLFALNKDVARMLTKAFSDKKVVKKYLAIARGFTEKSGRIDYPLKELQDKMTDQKARKDKPAQEAITLYKLINKAELPFPVRPYSTARYSLLEISLLTGRQRQIRRHLKHIFHHLIGDVRYGDGQHNQLFREKFDCHRMLLHPTFRVHNQIFHD